MKKFILMFALLCGISAFAAPSFQIPKQSLSKYRKATLSVAELDELLAANTQASKYDSNLQIVHIQLLFSNTMDSCAVFCKQVNNPKLLSLFHGNIMKTPQKCPNFWGI